MVRQTNSPGPALESLVRQGIELQEHIQNLFTNATTGHADSINSDPNEQLIVILNNVNRVINDAESNLPEILEGVGEVVYGVARESFLKQLLGTKLELLENIGSLIVNTAKNENIVNGVKTLLDNIKKLCEKFINYVKESFESIKNKFNSNMETLSSGNAGLIFTGPRASTQETEIFHSSSPDELRGRVPLRI